MELVDAMGEARKFMKDLASQAFIQFESAELITTDKRGGPTNDFIKVWKFVLNTNILGGAFKELVMQDSNAHVLSYQEIKYKRPKENDVK